MSETVRERIFRAFFVNRERGLTVHELAQYAYCTDDGGPLDTTNCLRTHVHHLNRQLVRHGWKISTDARGGRGARRRLMKV
jgi:hypothetical protein